MRKIIALLMTLNLTFCLAACGTEKTGVPAPDKSEFKVGAIYISSRDDTAGYTYAHHTGIVTAMESLGMDVEKQLLIVDEIPEERDRVLDAVDELVSKGVHIIFGISYGYMDAFEEAAAIHPNVMFSHGTGYKSNSTNFNNYFGRAYQARYLSGIAAGLKTENNQLGYVAAFDTVPEVVYSLNAFYLGAKSVNLVQIIAVLEEEYDGDKQWITFQTRFRDSSLLVTVSLGSGDDMLRYSVKVDWHEIGNSERDIQLQFFAPLGYASKYT